MALNKICITVVAAVIATASASAQNAPDGGETLNLMCFGAGSANKPNVATVQGYNSGTVNSYGQQLGSYNGSYGGTITGWRSQDFEDQVSLRLNGNEGRLRMPRTMLPVIRGGEDGWFKLKDIEYKPNEITASIAVNIFNNPKLRLDRYTGAISISGKAGDYAGRCQKFDPETERRAF